MISPSGVSQRMTAVSAAAPELDLTIVSSISYNQWSVSLYKEISLVQKGYWNKFSINLNQETVLSQNFSSDWAGCFENIKSIDRLQKQLASPK